MEMISDASLKEFKKLYLKRYGAELSNADALERANRLLNLYRAVYRKPLVIKIKSDEQKIRYTKNKS